MLRIDNLTKTYAGNSAPSVDSLSLEVADGEIFGGAEINCHIVHGALKVFGA